MVLLSYVYSAQDLHRFCDIEESLPENTPVRVSLTFNTTELGGLCEQINNECSRIGVTRLLDNYAYHNGNNIDIYWVKGLSWWGIILAVLISITIPPLIAASIYALLPETWRAIIDSALALSFLGIVYYISYKVIVGLSGG